MQTIEQLRQDIRPLRKLGTVSAVTGESLGSLLIRLAEKKTPLFLRRPHDARLYCVSQERDEEYQETILVLSERHMPLGVKANRKETTNVEASHFRYLVLMEHDYIDLIDGDVTLSVKLFSQAALTGNNKADPSVISAAEYFKEHHQKSHFHQYVKAKFACYFEEKLGSDAWPGALKLKRVQANAEDLLVSRTALLDLIDQEDKPNDLPPPELTEHLQSWKSDFLRALNIAAYKLFVHMSTLEVKSSEVKPETITEFINNQLPNKNSESGIKLSVSATLLRPELNQLNAKKHLKEKNIKQYPHYFSYKLIYLNEMCKKYHDEYVSVKDSHPAKTKRIEDELNKDEVLPENTVRRIANAIKPDYEKINRPEE